MDDVRTSHPILRQGGISVLRITAFYVSFFHPSPTPQLTLTMFWPSANARL